jgi:hypothetical protein
MRAALKMKIEFEVQNGYESLQWSLMSPVRLSLLLRTRKARLEYTTGHLVPQRKLMDPSYG